MEWVMARIIQTSHRRARGCWDAAAPLYERAAAQSRARSAGRAAAAESVNYSRFPPGRRRRIFLLPAENPDAAFPMLAETRTQGQATKSGLTDERWCSAERARWLHSGRDSLHA